MRYSKSLALILGVALHAGLAYAQESSEADRVANDRRLVEEARRQAGAAAERAETARSEAESETRVVEREVITIEEEMRAAEARLEEAARRIAELSTRRLPRVGGEDWEFAFSGRLLLGISIDGEGKDGPVEGVVVRGVTPGGAAFDAGLRAEDVLTAINGESLAAGNGAAANRKLLDFMSGVEEGDSLEVEYLRGGRAGSVELTPQVGTARHFSFALPRSVPVAPTAPRAPRAVRHFSWLSDTSWGDMEMVPLTEGLARYFGTERGLLVVRAPSDETFQLQDGDVIRSIGGREPDSVSHAVRILASYQPGEQLEIEIMRDKRRQTLEIEVPDNRRSGGPRVLPEPPAPGVIIDVRRHRERR